MAGGGGTQEQCENRVFLASMAGGGGTAGGGDARATDATCSAGPNAEDAGVLRPAGPSTNASGRAASSGWRGRRSSFWRWRREDLRRARTADRLLRDVELTRQTRRGQGGWGFVPAHPGNEGEASVKLPQVVASVKLRRGSGAAVDDEEDTTTPVRCADLKL